MKKNKGYVMSTYVYMILVFFLLFMVTLVLVMNNNKLLQKKIKNQISDKGQTTYKAKYAYTGDVQTFIAPYTGTYQLEVWGAQGGNAYEGYNGGYGGYSRGEVKLNKGDKLYVYVGSQGKSNCTGMVCEGGYNGGGSSGYLVYPEINPVYNAGGGGATHIATTTGLLSAKSTSQNDILIIAGGGGGSTYHLTISTEPSVTTFGFSHNGGNAGGIEGNGACLNTDKADDGSSSGCGGTQTSAGGVSVNDFSNIGSFGQGGSNDCAANSLQADTFDPQRKCYAPGAGGGFYGGSTGTHGVAGGGSGYIGNSKLTNKVMYCYNCEESSETSTKTISINESGKHEENKANEGHGYAIITYIPSNDENGVPVNNCTYEGELVQGAEYTNGQYTYRYMQEYDFANSTWNNITDNGWGVTLTDKTSTEPVTTKLCTSINDKPIVSMQDLFFRSQATSIDLSSYDTSNVVNMYAMFHDSKATSIDLSSFNTRKVRNMQHMFSSSKFESIDVSNFDTSSVIDMTSMFNNTAATEINLTNFNTSNVENMYAMFLESNVSTIDLSSFDTKNVTNMSCMFRGAKATSIIGLNNLNTSKVTDMSHMFEETSIATINLDNLNTSKVTDMSHMFEDSSATTINLHNLNTSSVTNMYAMFYNSKASIFDLSSFDTTNLTNFDVMFQFSTATTGYARTQADANKFNSSSEKPSTLTFTVKS